MRRRSGVHAWRSSALAAVVLAALLILPACQPSRYTIVGDSVTYQARRALAKRDARVAAYPGAQLEWSRAVLRREAARDPEVLVIALGNLDVGRGHPEDEVRETVRAIVARDVRRVDCVIWLAQNENPNVHENWPARAAAFNRMLDDVLPPHGDRVHRWTALAANHPEWFRDDGIHLTMEGRPGYARMVGRAVRRHC